MPICAYCHKAIAPGEGRVAQGVSFCNADHFQLYVAAERRTP